MKLDKKSVLVGAIAILGIIVTFYIGRNIYMAGGSGVSRASACADMRDVLRQGREHIENNTASRDLIKAMANLNNEYAQICL